jgi:predicted nucleotidyltransferase
LDCDRPGIRDLKHLSKQGKKHEASAAHIENDVKFNLFSYVNILSQLNEGYRVSIQHHNELVDKNRHILGRIINCIKFCGTHELSRRGHDESETSYNRGIFLDLVSELASSDSILDEHLCSATVSKNTTKTIQNELLDCMYEVYKQTLMEEIQNANFVSIQADETTDISCMSQFVI